MNTQPLERSYLPSKYTFSRYTHKYGFTDIHIKVRPNMRQFSRKSQMQKSIICRSLIPVFTKFGQ